MAPRLSFLQLHGYKTFANLTPFDLSARITAIVGPNGSGKSNIADCIRWVLGEQSFSLLRGRKTEDMIFSGSEARPRLGMASATITFNNEDGWMPIEFSEVAVTRRAYRDGDNEYLVNGQRVRLKDVSELLYPSGLAERTYTVIGQGLVDAVLSLRADERRRLFEEAAGIGLYRSRREEALRRLDSTRRNLERVQDILIELTPRLASLERQARRAREHAQAVGELRSSLREWYGYHWQHAQGELAVAQENARLQDQKLNSVRLEQSERDRQITDLRHKIQVIREQLGGLHHELAELHSRREAVSRDLAVAGESSRLLEKQLEDTEPDLLNLAVQIDQAQSMLVSSNSELENCQQEIDEATSQLASTQLELAELKSARLQFESSLLAAQRRVAELSDSQGQLSALLSGNQARLSRLKSSLEENQLELAASGKRLEEMKVTCDSAIKNAAAEEKAVRLLERQLSDQQEKTEKAEGKRSALADQRSRKAAELVGWQAQLEILLQSEAALSGYAPGTRLLLEAATRGSLPGIVGAVSDLLDVPPELETPIAAALGEFVDSVVIERSIDEALDLLSNEHSRGILLPLHQLSPDSSHTAGRAGSEDYIGMAAELVNCPEHLRPVISLLLGDVLVVRDRLAARRVLSANRYEGRVVTLAGEVFHSSGLIQSSTADKRSSANVLGRKRQHAELDHLIAEARRQLEKFDDRLTTAVQQLENLKTGLLKLNQEKESQAESWRLRLTEVHRLELDLDKERQVSKFIEQQMDGYHVEIQEVVAEIQLQEGSLARIAAELDLARLETRNLQSRLSEYSSDEISTRVSYWSTQVAIAEARRLAINDRIKERQNSLEQLTSSRESVENRRSGLATALQELKAQKEELQTQDMQIGERLKSQQALIDPGEAELVILEKDLEQSLEFESTFRQRLSMAEQLNAQTRIHLDRKQEALQSLQRRIEDDFGLVAFEYAQEISGPKPLPLEGMVEQLPHVTSLPPGLEEAIHRQRLQIRRLGPINPEAQEEYQEVSDRHHFLTSQVSDLTKADEDIRQVIRELDELMERDFQKTYYAVAEEFKEIFTRLFGGGSARLVLTNPDDISSTGIDIEARLPGRRSQGLALLSGGERSLTATALVFALIRVSPPPFCVLDEVDAMLDEVNVSRFRELLNELSQKTQIIIITHNRNTVQVADVIYGVTMGRDSVSQVLSLKLDELGDLVE